MNMKELDDEIIRLAAQARLDSWNAFVDELQIPSEVYPAIVTMRAELMSLAQRRPLSAEEADALYKLIAGLIDTNSALRLHAQQVAEMARQFSGAMRGVISTAMKIKRFAEFRHSEMDEGESIDLER